MIPLWALLLVAQEDPLRVLLIEGSPRFEYRHLRGALLKDPDIRLRSFLTSADDEWEQPASAGETPLTRKTALELLARPEGVDILIWGDLPPERLEPKDPDRIAAALEAFVGGGGGLLLIAGPSYERQHAWWTRVFPPGPRVAAPEAGPADNLPALLRALGADDIEKREEAVASLLKLGPPAIPALRAAMSGADDEQRDRLRRVLEELQTRGAGEALSIRATSRAPEDWRGDLWTAAPRIRWWLRYSPPKEAETWVEMENGDPLLSIRALGKGRAALLATDEWWLWRRSRGDRDYYATYKTLLRRLAGR